MEGKTISPWTWGEELGMVQGYEISVSQRLFLSSGLASIDDDGNVVHEGDMAAQAHKALDNLETVLGAAGLTLSNVVRLNYYATDCPAFMVAYKDSIQERLREAGCVPTSMLIGVAELGYPGMIVEVQATAVA